ncbi:MAG: hypothetical protein HY064_06265 [Bacteroidetes bacterium]|nr:hypothetical protein [Bacteroidota bacterium]
MTTLLEVIISLAFIFLIFSIIVSGVCELWQLFTHKRGRFLYKALNDVFNDPINKDFTFKLLSHPLIDRLRESDTRYPHYIGAEIFSDALIDVIRSDHQLPEYSFDRDQKKFLVQQPLLTPPLENGGKEIFSQFLQGTDQLKESDLKQLLRTFAFGAADYETLRAKIKSWYGNYMMATSTWYKKSITRSLLVISAVVTISFNIDSIHIAKQLFADKNLRLNIVQNADQYIHKQQQQDSLNKVIQTDSAVKDLVKKNVDRIKTAYTESGLLDLPIGWPKPESQNLILMIFGWMITIGALGYGADNWFNLLVRLLNIRTSVKPKE